MFSDESQNDVVLINRLNIAIVDLKEGENDLYNILTNKMKEEPFKFNILLLKNLEQLYNTISYSFYDKNNALLNMQWIDWVYNKRPSTIILYHYIKEGSTKEKEEIYISEIINKIKSNDQNLPLYLFIIVPHLEYDKYQHLKDDDKSPNSLRKKLKKENFYIFSSKEILKNVDIKKLYDNLVIYSRNYYKQIKNVMKSKIKEAPNEEEVIKYSIMIGVISIIKSKRKNKFYSKYLKEAYMKLVNKNFNYKSYYYGNNENEFHNYLEIKAVADWLLFKNIKSKNKKNIEIYNSNKKKQKIVNKDQNFGIQNKIDTFIEHIKIFTSRDFGKKEDDSFYFYNLFWKYKRYINLSEFCDNHFNELKKEKKYMLKIIQIKFDILYTFIKMMKFLQKYYNNIDLNKTIIDSKEIPFSNIFIKYNPFYGKPPIYSYKNENDDKENLIGFNDDIFLKYTIIKNDLTFDKLDETFKGELIKNILTFYYKEKISEIGFEISNSENNDEFQMIGVELYLNILRFYTNYPKNKENDNLLEYKDEKNINFELYKIFEKSLTIRKFPKIYIRFLGKNVDYFIYQMKNQKEKFDNIKKTILFKSLSILASFRLLTEQEQDIFNELLNDEEFIPTKYEQEIKKPNISSEIKDFFVSCDSETKEKEKESPKKKEEENKDEIKQYIKEGQTLINLYCSNKMNKEKEEKGILFEYEIKDIDKSQERKILDLVEYEFKISTKLKKIKLKFENIKIFLIYTNKGTKKKYKTETLIKEFTNEYLSNKELTVETPINLEHKIFLKYREGKIIVKKILFTLSQKKDIIYSVDFPNDIKKVIFIKNVQTNVLKFNYINNFKVGKNQYNPFELQIFKEKNDEVEIKDLKIQYETLPSFQAKELSSVLTLKDDKNKKIKNNQQKKQEGNIWSELYEEKSVINRGSQDIDKNSLKMISQTSLNLTETNMHKSTRFYNSKKGLKSVIKLGKEDKYIHKYIPPEFYRYNGTEDKLEKYNEKMEINYNDFESLLNQGKNDYTILVRFLSEGIYKIMFAIKYFIRHKKIEEYIENTEESILEFNVINPFILERELSSHNYFKYHEREEEKKDSDKDKKHYYLTNCKIRTNFIITNKIEKDIKIKEVEIIPKKDNNSVKYINSYINDLIHSYDLEEEEKKEILVIKKNSTYVFPFETEFSEPFMGSIGKINILWSTDNLDNFEKGKLDLINKEEYYFPEMEVKSAEFEYKYQAYKKNTDEILLELKVKNISNISKQIEVKIVENKENKDKKFIIIGINKRSYLININEEIEFNYTLIPFGRGEFYYPYFQISECDLNTFEKKIVNCYFSENIAII